MLEFHPLKLNDYKRIDTILKKDSIENADHCFAPMYVWSYIYPVEVCVYENTVFMRTHDEKSNEDWYLAPCGDLDFSTSLELILKDNKKRNFDLIIYSLSNEQEQIIKEKYSQDFEIEYNRDNADYIYLTQDLINLEGKKYQKKRNHISRFKRDNPNYEFVLINKDNAHEAEIFEDEWFERNRAEYSDDLAGEREAIDVVLENFEELELMGGMIKVDGEIVAITVASAINDNMVDIIVEKAVHEINGAYAIINNEFAKNCLSKFKYINREDDLGEEGLRKAKLSYFPAEIREKINIKYIKR